MCDDADDRVEAAAVDGEAGQPGRPGRVRDVLGGRLGLQGGDLHARGHHVLRGQVGQIEGADEQFGGVRLQRARLRRVPGQRDQLLRGCGRRPAPRPAPGRSGARSRFAVLLRWLMSGPEDGGEDRAAGVATRLGHGQRRGDRPVLRAPARRRPSGTTVDSAVPSTRRHRGGRAAETPIARSGPREQLRRSTARRACRSTRLVTVMPSWAPESWKVRLRTAFRAPSAPALAALRRPLQLAALDRGQGELRRDETRRRPARAAPPRAAGALRSSVHLRPMIGQGRRSARSLGLSVMSAATGRLAHGRTLTPFGRWRRISR